MAEPRTIGGPELVQFSPSQPSQRNRENSLARRRYQKGCLKFVRGKWIGRWREDVVLSNGTIKRQNRKKVLGTREDFKTKREAQRAMDLILSPINSLDYRPTHQITFAEFARRWFEMIHPIAYKEGGSQATAGRHVKGKLIPTFGHIELKDITTEVLQRYVADSQQRGLGGKYIRNVIGTMSTMWDVAVSWGYITHKPFASLILPACDRSDVEPYSEEEVMKIFRAAREPFRTFLWILGEAGMRPGEVCALDARYIHLEDRVISVRQSESLGHIRPPENSGGLPRFRHFGTACKTLALISAWKK